MASDAAQADKAEEFTEAAAKGNLDRLSRLLDGGLPIDVCNLRVVQGWNALMAAAAHGKGSFRLLLERAPSFGHRR